MNIQNLNQFKKFLQVGTKIKSQRSDGTIKNRIVTIKQTKSIKFDNGSWLNLTNAKDFIFHADKIELLCGGHLACTYFIE